jgi:hypothetical protein
MIMLAGLLRAAAADNAVRLFLAAYAVVVTVFCGFVWWLNEVRGVRKIERLRAQVTSETEQGETSS